MKDFIVEFIHPTTHLNEHTNDLQWILNVDGSSTDTASGAGIVLITPEGHKLEYAVRFKFPASNKEAEYEALIAGLRMARRMGAEHVVVRSDSQLVVEQVQRDYESRGEKMQEYCKMAKNLAKQFSTVLLERVPRQQNKEAGRLARVASSQEEDPGIPMELLESPSIQSPEIH